jgi:hypothetical protein
LYSNFIWPNFDEKKLGCFIKSKGYRYHFELKFFKNPTSTSFSVTRFTYISAKQENLWGGHTVTGLTGVKQFGKLRKRWWYIQEDQMGE